MAIVLLDRLLSLGASDTIPQRLMRHIRVTNALALLGVALTITGLPLDILAAPLPVVVNDVLGLAGFVACWILHGRGHRLAGRVVLGFAADASVLYGMHQIGPTPEVCTLCFPLALLPFLVFPLSERLWLSVFVGVPTAAYFVLGVVDRPPQGLVVEVYAVYAPILAFAMTIAGSGVFAYIDRSAEDKFLQAQERATQGARLVALGEMSSGIAHEIRNPLAAIHLAATQIAERPEQTSQVAQLGERIQRIAMRASGIIEALRSFARDATGDPVVPTPLERIVGDALELCGKRFADHGIELTVAPLPAGLVIECRSVQISQVLVNVLGNAYDAAAHAPERWVRIDVRVDGEWLELAVTDSGAGVPVAARNRIFEPFFTTKAPDRGTGIGLSLSRGLVEAHHGTLSLDTESPRTRFVIRVPLTQPLDPM